MGGTFLEGVHCELSWMYSDSDQFYAGDGGHTLEFF